MPFIKLYPDSVAPVRNEGDAGWDLTMHHGNIHPDSEVYMIHTGVSVEIPNGYFGLLRPRSSLSHTQYLFCSSGIIDASYRGEIIVPLRRAYGSIGKRYAEGDRIAQLLILPLPDVRLVEVSALSETERGIGGFGSTGI